MLHTTHTSMSDPVYVTDIRHEKHRNVQSDYVSHSLKRKKHNFSSLLTGLDVWC